MPLVAAVPVAQATTKSVAAVIARFTLTVVVAEAGGVACAALFSYTIAISSYLLALLILDLTESK